jgi:hypothetical protein
MTNKIAIYLTRDELEHVEGLVIDSVEEQTSTTDRQSELNSSLAVEVAAAIKKITNRDSPENSLSRNLTEAQQLDLWDLDMHSQR